VIFVTDRQQDRVHQLGAGLEAAAACLAGEAGELATRRPHPDGHLYDVEEGLRLAAEGANDRLTEAYYR